MFFFPLLIYWGFAFAVRFGAASFFRFAIDDFLFPVLSFVSDI